IDGLDGEGAAERLAVDARGNRPVARAGARRIAVVITTGGEEEEGGGQRRGCCTLHDVVSQVCGLRRNRTCELASGAESRSNKLMPPSIQRGPPCGGPRAHHHRAVRNTSSRALRRSSM